MSVIQLFSGAASLDETPKPDEGTYLTMFTESEHLSLGLLMNRKMGEGEDLFKDCELQANRNVASLALRFSAEQAAFMHIDKIRNRGGNEFTYKLRQENEAEVVCDNLWDVYDIARDRISIMLGEPLFDEALHTERQSPSHLHIVSP